LSHRWQTARGPLDRLPGSTYKAVPSAFALRAGRIAQVAQLVEHVTENHGVGCSIHPLGTNKIKHLTPCCAPDNGSLAAHCHNKFYSFLCGVNHFRTASPDGLPLRAVEILRPSEAVESEAAYLGRVRRDRIVELCHCRGSAGRPRTAPSSCLSAT
jgi:hypothetical protein